VVKLASEFPNDNPALHRGVIWVCAEPTGRPQPERACSSEPPHRPSVLATDPAATDVLASREEHALEAIEAAPCVVASMVEESAIDVVASMVEESAIDVAALLDESAPEAIEEPALAAAPADVIASTVAPIVSQYDSLAPPEDDEEDAGAQPIVVEELEPVEASVEGMTAEDAAVAVPVVVEQAATMTTPAVVDAASLDVVAASNVVEGIEAVAVEAVADVLDQPLREPPPPAVSEVVLAAGRHDVEVDAVEAGAAGGATPVFEEVAANDVSLHDSSVLPPAPDDPFTVLVCMLADVAIGAGSPHVASLLPGLLFDGRLPEILDADAAEALRESGLWDGARVAPAFVAVTSAWCAILRGTSDDFDACGSSMLDEWAADLLARLLAAPAKAPSLRQELRSRGVAAFGLAA